ncbi:hypothetical protein LTR95_014449 [Oleoguttula sp. CCFEE 5521]
MSRSSKRARVSQMPFEQAVLNPPIHPDKHTLLTAWAKDQGVSIHAAAARVLPGRGAGLVATAPISSGSSIVSVPSPALFKPDANVLKRHGLNRTASPQAKLAFSLVVARAEERLVEWSATWPTMEEFEASMPMFWPERVLVHLPASVSAPLARQRSDYARDWRVVRKAVEGLGLGERRFGYAWCIANSRSFSWIGQMVLCPWVDYMNHAAKGNAEVIVGEGGFEVKAGGDIAESEELTFAYGAHANDKLLVHYGFVPESTEQHANPDDEMRMDHMILPHLSEEVKSQLQDLGYLGSYALLPVDNPCKGDDYHAYYCEDQVWEPCFKTQVAVRAAVLSCNEWEYFATSGEDLGKDKCQAVLDWLQPHIDRAWREAQDHLMRYHPEKDTQNAVALALLNTRWTQICLAFGSVRRPPDGEA